MTALGFAEFPPEHMQDVLLTTQEADSGGGVGPELTVAQKRRALAMLRRGWEEVRISRRQRPMYLSGSLGLGSAPDLTFEEFALRFVLLHHSKRSSGSNQSDAQAVGDEGEAETAGGDSEEAEPAFTQSLAKVAAAGASVTAPCR